MIPFAPNQKQQPLLSKHYATRPPTRIRRRSGLYPQQSYHYRPCGSRGGAGVSPGIVDYEHPRFDERPDYAPFGSGLCDARAVGDYGAREVAEGDGGGADCLGGGGDVSAGLLGGAQAPHDPPEAFAFGARVFQIAGGWHAARAAESRGCGERLPECGARRARCGGCGVPGDEQSHGGGTEYENLGRAP